MIRKYLLPVVAVAGLAFAIWMVKQAAKPVIPAKPVAEPARSPSRIRSQEQESSRRAPATFPLAPMFQELWPGSLL